MTLVFMYKEKTYTKQYVKTILVTI